MVLSNTTAFLFTNHFIFLIIKAWFLYKLSVLFNIVKAPKKEKFLLLFEKKEIALYFTAIIILLNELYFIYAFFNPIIPHKYQYIEIICYTYIMIYIVNKMKDEKNGNS